MPETVSDTREHLTRHVARFREQGIEAEPVIFGERRKPQAALLPFETFELLLDLAEDAVIAERVRQRDAVDSGNRTTLSELADEFDVDVDDL